MFGAWRRGSASALGAESRWFKSSRPDHFGVVTVCRDSFFLFVVRRRSRRSAALKPRKGSDCAKLCAFWSERACGRPASRRCPSRLARRWRASCAARCRKRRDMCRRQCLLPCFYREFSAPLGKSETWLSDKSELGVQCFFGSRCGLPPNRAATGREKEGGAGPCAPGKKKFFQACSFPTRIAAERRAQNENLLSRHVFFYICLTTDSLLRKSRA